MDSAQSLVETVERLDEILATVRSKDTALDKSLDLLEEAVGLGLRAVELVDSPQFTGEEQAQIDAARSETAGSGEHE